MKIPPDKYMHYAWCVTIALGAGFITWWLGLAAAMIIGFSKEIIDSQEKGNHFCWWDLLADAIGAVVGILPHL